MGGHEQEEAPAPRRRRRAVRRAAGPPGPHVVDVQDDVPPATVDRLELADTFHAALPDPHPEPDPGAPSHGHPHVPGPGHGPPPTNRESAPQHPTGTGDPQRRYGRSAREDAAERSLRSLVTTRSSQVSPVAAMRAREVALPTDADLAAADEEVTIVRRHYVPPTALTAGRRPDRPRRRPGDSGQ